MITKAIAERIALEEVAGTLPTLEDTPEQAEYRVELAENIERLRSHGLTVAAKENEMGTKEANEAGRKAFADGRSRTPVHNQAFLTAVDVSGKPFGVMLIAYLRGWDAANLSIQG